MRVPFSATDRFISSTSATSPPETTTKMQNVSKYAGAEAWVWRRWSRVCNLLSRYGVSGLLEEPGPCLGQEPLHRRVERVQEFAEA